MRYNEKELQALSRQPAEMAAELGMRGPKKGSGAYVCPGSRVRWWPRTGPAITQSAHWVWFSLSFFSDPSARSQLREVQSANVGCIAGTVSAALSATGFVEDLSRKYHFECCSQEQCQDWMEALQRASYEYMRQSLIFYRNEIRKMTGKDPLEQFGISEEARFQLNSLPKDGRTTCIGSQLNVLD